MLLKVRLTLGLILDIQVQFIYFCLHDGIALLRCWRVRLMIRRIPRRFFALGFDLELVDFIAQLADVQIIWTVANQHLFHLRFKLLQARLGGRIGIRRRSVETTSGCDSAGHGFEVDLGLAIAGNSCLADP